MREMNRLKSFAGLLKSAAAEWRKDNASKLAAALSYYTIFSLVPIVTIMLTVLGWVFRDGDTGALMLKQVSGLIGESGAEVFYAMIRVPAKPAQGFFTALFGAAAALFGATGVFVQLKDALNTAWGITEPRFRGVKGFLRVRAVSLAAILVIDFMLLVSLFASAALSAFTARLQSDNAVIALLIQLSNQILSVCFIMVLFAFIFRFLPDMRIPWKDVWVGALFTSVLFNIGKYLIGVYLGNSSIGTGFGAAGSILVLLVWVYYSAQLMLFGAEFTQVYGERYGSGREKGRAKENSPAAGEA